jgi:hypothetical protein
MAARKWGRGSIPRWRRWWRMNSRSISTGQGHGDDDRQGAEHLGDGCVVGVRPQRHGRRQCGAADQGAAGDVRRRTLGCQREGRLFEPNMIRVGANASPFRSSSRSPTDPASSCRRRVSTRRRKSTGTVPRAGAGRSSITSPMVHLFGSQRRYADRRISGRSHRRAA